MKWLKHKLREWVFRDEELEYKARLSAQRQMAENANVTALARQNLSSFDPSLIDFEVFQRYEELDITEGMDEEERAHFLNEAHALYTNDALRVIVNFLIRHQVLFGQKTAESLLALNFSRGTTNGISLLMEEVETAEGKWQEAHNKREDEDFDPHAVT